MSNGTGYAAVAEIRFVGDVQASVNAKPVPPTITPGSGGYLSGGATITMASLTTSAVMHYTSDGTTPTCSSAIYSAPFTLAIGAATVLQAVACDATLSTAISDVSTQQYRNYGMRAGTLEYDDHGDQVNLNSGDMTYIPSLDKWYRVGTDLSGIYNGPGGEVYEDIGIGWYIYSASPDPVTRTPTVWKYEGQITGNQGFPMIVRVHLVYNEHNGTFVVWGNGYANGFKAIILSATLANLQANNWTVANAGYLPGGNNVFDMCLFVDSDAEAYVVFQDGAGHVFDFQLSDDYLTAIGSPTTVYSGIAREAPAMLRRNGSYFIITSQPDNSATQTNIDLEYQVSTTGPLGPYGGTVFLLSRTLNTLDCAYNSQSTAVVKVPYKADAYMFVGDAWCPAQRTDTAGAQWNTLQGTPPFEGPLRFPTATSVVLDVGPDFSPGTSGKWDFSWWANAVVPTLYFIARR